MTTSDLTPRSDMSALFIPEGECLVPTAFAVGPWRPDALHGGAVAALFAAALESEDRALARVTVDLLAAVRLHPLRLEVNDESAGRKVQRRSLCSGTGSGPWPVPPRSTSRRYIRSCRS